MRDFAIFRRWRIDRLLVAVLIIGGLLVAGRSWLHEHPQHDPWAPLDLRHPPGMAMPAKLASLRGDAARCRDVLARSEVVYEELDPTGEGQCLRSDRTVGGDLPLSPTTPPVTCAVVAGMTRWIEQGVTPAAIEELGAPIDRIEHLGAYSCRRIYGSDRGNWSEHSTGNAIDIAAFVLSDGRRISVLEDWNTDSAEARFLHRTRDAACDVFGTVLSPDYNQAHRDHFHLDQADRSFGSYCR